MANVSSPKSDLELLYRRAFVEYGSMALWSMRPVENPAPADALAVTKALRTHGGMDGRRLAEEIERLCVAEADGAALIDAGLELFWKTIRTGKRDAQVKGLGETTQLEWVADSDFRFFPAQPDRLFGYVLHPVDLATNKASAAADRREARDIVDLVTIHERILPLGAVIAAAVGRFPGMSPEEMLSEITRHSRFTAEEFRALAAERLIDASDLHRRIRKMLEEAESYLSRLPSE